LFVGYKIIFLAAFSFLVIAFHGHSDQAVMAGTTNSCMHCRSHPCLWNRYGEQVMHDVLIFENSLEGNSRFRLHVYQAFVKMYHEMLGHSHRIEIPKCVLTGISKLWPDKNNNCIRHRDAKQGSNVD
jgi:hypothetical protein